MTTKDFRSAVFAELQAWGAAYFPTLPIVYENGPVPDQDSIGPIWLDAELRWYSGNIASVGSTPRTRDTGSICLMCYFKDAEGTGLTDDVLDSLSQTFTVRRLGGAVLGARQRTVPAKLTGWYSTGILVPFTLG